MKNTILSISSQRDAYLRTKRLFYLFIVIIFIIGNVIDLIKPKAGLTNQLIYINGIYIITSILFLGLYLLKKASLTLAASITLYALLFNILISLALSTNEPDFEIYYMREMMILGIMIIPTGFILNKHHVIVFGCCIFALYTGISFFTDSPFLRDNYLLLLLALISYTFWVYYIMFTLEKWIDNQNKLIKKLEQKNKSIENKREQLKKINQTKDRIFSIIAHDLKNPFNSIIGFSDLLLLKHKKTSPEKKEKYLKIINQAASESETLLNNILSWATSQTEDISFNPKRIDTDKLFDNLNMFFKANCEAKEIDLTFENNCHDKLIADGNMLTTILRNLLSNAIKYTPQGGKVHVKCSNTSNSCVFHISDSGVGMSISDQKKLFKSIGKLQKKGTNMEKGTGLGLIICKDLVERHGGYLKVESDTTKGTTFSFTLPDKNTLN